MERFSRNVTIARTLFTIPDGRQDLPLQILTHALFAPDDEGPHYVRLERIPVRNRVPEHPALRYIKTAFRKATATNLDPR